MLFPLPDGGITHHPISKKSTALHLQPYSFLLLAFPHYFRCSIVSMDRLYIVDVVIDGDRRCASKPGDDAAPV